MEFCIFEKVNGSIVTKLRVTLLNNRKEIFRNIFCELHNPMTKWYSTLFKYENKLKFSLEN